MNLARLFRSATPTDELADLLELTTKAGRRCAHDLDHAADLIGDQDYREHFRACARLWLGVFYPDRGPKNYRTEFHKRVFDLECEVNRLRRVCEAAGVDSNDPNGMPF